MPVREYILVQTVVGRSDTVVVDLEALDGVQSAAPVSGQYDVILVTEHHSPNELVDRIEDHPGVARVVRLGVGTEGPDTA
jgi:hypothetical protein